MEIRIRSTGAVVTDREFRGMFPNTSLPRFLTEELLNSLEADPVLEGPQASGGTVYQYSQRQGVEQVNGKWYTKYVLGPVFAEYTNPDGLTYTVAEQEANYKAQKDAEQAKSVRDDRNRRIAESDWTQGKDIADNISTAWATYRQALRDVPAQAGFPWTVEWPTKPE